ncbi:DEAD/H associated domain protein [Anaeromyxobacter sp. K]|uniref:Lhr family helicase n=1 Tax=Anaeromyxobacter sp. (strain K) TaxID=447217 RepID=UPI00017BE2E6|nr:DEAD/DEAH box helicase [Anaeromyxobacter sp. K]ACG73015.1 DEAD/H associated domain protein [Anaeromyxobacter sp. K]
MARSPGPAAVPFHPAVRAWFERAFAAPTRAQALGWPPIHRGERTLLLAPTGSGKTLAAFLSCIDRLMFSPEPARRERLRVVYVSPLKALAVDVERNLRAPLAGIAQVAAARGDAHRIPTVAVRTGDTPAAERARFARDPADILITTPESLYLLLTQAAREGLRTVETVIVDEIHALVPSKRGAHLALSLERLEQLAGRPLQRIGLSATQRPLDEVARFLGGAVPAAPAAAGEAEGALGELRDRAARPAWRPVTVVDAGSRKPLELTVEVPVEDMARLGEPLDLPGGDASQAPPRASIWTAIHPRLLELVQAHRTTLLFVNSRRVAERLAGALNELAGETLVQAHHGSIARPQRIAIEDNLKAGRVRGLVATSSLELGIDMGSVDLVVQIEAPPSVASGMQRIGRAGHQVGAPSAGVLFPKYRGDLVACAALTEAMQEGDVEATRYLRNPLDVLAQQIVAMVSLDDWRVDDLHAALRGAAPFAELPRGILEGVLDLLSGRYPSEELAELRPRVTWDRVRGVLRAREGARRVAVVSGGTIPDRGLYGVYLLGGAKGQARVGELDEEMVFETAVGETFTLGASTWRVEEITHDRVLVSPAPGEPGKMPFWHGDAAARPVELGRRIGRLVRELRGVPRAAALERLRTRHGLDARAAENLVRYLEDQQQAAGAVPDDRTVLVERCRDELGDWRVCVLAPFGSALLVPWCMAAARRARDRLGADPETLWTNDGFALRLPETDQPPEVDFLFPEPEEVEALVVEQLGATALFAARFREASARALLLPRRRPGQRTPLWQQRKRAADLLAVASRFAQFPLLLEAYRECLRDVFDLPALVELMRDLKSGRVRRAVADTRVPSPFAGSLLFGFVASFIYDGDAPLAERRAQALAIDQAQLRELLGEAELRELLDADALADLEARLQLLPPELRVRSADGLADMLLRLGDLTRAEVERRAASPEVAASLDRLVAERRAVALRVGGEERFVAVEDAARYRDGLGVPLPPGVPEALLAPVPDALDGLVARYARRHAPFTAGELAARLGLARAAGERVLERLGRAGRLLEGAFRPHGAEREWCDPDVLRTLRRRSLAKLREEIEPVEPRVLGRTLLGWHGITRRTAGLDAVLDAVEKLQGAPLPASLLESEILPARVEGYLPGDLDALAAGGEVTWVGLEPLGERDGRVALFLADALPALLPPARPAEPPEDARERRILEHLARRGACFFPELHEAAGGGFAQQTVDAIWALVWRGLVTNDTFQVLRARAARSAPRRDRERARRTARRASAAGYRSRLSAPPGAGGRWTLVEARRDAGGRPRPTPTQWSAAVAQQLLARYGVVTRGVAAAEALPGGFGAVYDVLRHLEESGRIRRGYFVAGVGAMQFAQPGALDLLRASREPGEAPEVVTLAAADPANAWGALVEWPPVPGAPDGKRPARAVGAQVVLVDGAPGAWVARGLRQVLAWLPEDEPDRSRVGEAVAAALAGLARDALARGEGALLEEVNGAAAAEHPLAGFLVQAGFSPAGTALQLPRRAAGALTLPSGAGLA